MSTLALLLLLVIVAFAVIRNIHEIAAFFEGFGK